MGLLEETLKKDKNLVKNLPVDERISHANDLLNLTANELSNGVRRTSVIYALRVSAELAEMEPVIMGRIDHLAKMYNSTARPGDSIKAIYIANGHQKTKTYCIGDN